MSLCYELRKVTEKFDGDVIISGLVPSQTSRQNHPADSCMEYFRRSFYVPLLNHFIADLNERLIRCMNLFQFRVVGLLPKPEITSDDKISMKGVVNSVRI